MAELALGTVQFGLAYGIAGRGAPVPESEVRAILERASAAGVRRIDTAPGYGDIEERLGRLVGDLPFEIVSKIPALPRGLDGSAAVDFVTASIERSHARLGNLLGGILFHCAEDLAEEHGRAIGAHSADMASRLGIALGISCYDPVQIETLGDVFPVRMAQLPGNAFDQRLIDANVSADGVELSLRSVFLQGLLLMEPDEAIRRVPAAGGAITAWRHWCDHSELDPLTAALGIAKGLPDVRYCVVGVDDVAQLEEILRGWRAAAPIAARELAIDDASIIDPRCWAEQR